MGSIQGCRVLKIKGVRNLIEKYRPHQSFTRSAAQIIIGDVNLETGPDFQKYEDLVMNFRNVVLDKVYNSIIENNNVSLLELFGKVNEKP